MDPPAVREDAGATTLTVTAMLVGGTRTVETPISLTLVDGTATSADYTATDATLTLAPGASRGAATLTITPLHDNLDEPDESVTVNGATTVAGLAVTPATLTMIDTDVASTSVTLEVAPATVVEHAGPTTLTVTATLDAAARSEPLMLELGVGDGTATSADYAATDAVLTIAAEQVVGTAELVLTPVDDRLEEADETVLVTGTTSSSELVVVPATITIAHNACPGVVFDGRRPRSSDRVLETTLSLQAPRSLDGLILDWIGPYYDDEEDPENRRTYPILEVQIADWRMESTPTVTRHSFDIRWPRFAEAHLRLYTRDGPCALPALVCDVSGCGERR